MNEVKTTILVSSCDKYSDLWFPFFNLYQKYWPDCIHCLVLITEKLEHNGHKVKSLKLGKKDWSTLLLEALEHIQTDTVILTLEDFFLRYQVDNSRLNYLLNIFDENNLNMLRLIPRPGPDMISGISDQFGLLSKKEKYRVSTQAAIWRVEVLKSLLKKGESAWEFEINGTSRALECKDFYCVYKQALPYYHHVIERGKWFPWYAYRFNKMNIGVNLQNRLVLSKSETATWLIKKLSSILLKPFR